MEDQNLKTNKQHQENLSENLKGDFNYYLSKIQKCPKCNNDDYISYCQMGRPAPILIELQKYEIVRLGGCCMEPDSKNLYCRKCKNEF